MLRCRVEKGDIVNKLFGSSSRAYKCMFFEAGKKGFVTHVHVTQIPTLTKTFGISIKTYLQIVWVRRVKFSINGAIHSFRGGYSKPQKTHWHVKSLWGARAFSNISQKGQQSSFKSCHSMAQHKKLFQFTFFSFAVVISRFLFCHSNFFLVFTWTNTKKATRTEKMAKSFSIYPVNGTSFSMKAKKSTWINHTCFTVHCVPGPRSRSRGQPWRSVVLRRRLIVNFYSILIAITVDIHSIWIFNVVLIWLDIIFAKRCRARALWGTQSLLII